MIKIGLDKYQKAVDFLGIQKILENTVAAYKKFPCIVKGNDGWNNVQWSFDRSWKHVLWDNHLSNCNIGSNFNIIDVLTEEQMQYLATNLNLDRTLYKEYFIEE